MTAPVARRNPACRASPAVNGSTVGTSSSCGPDTLTEPGATTTIWAPGTGFAATASSVGSGEGPSGCTMTTTVRSVVAGSARREGTESREP